MSDSAVPARGNDTAVVVHIRRARMEVDERRVGIAVAPKLNADIARTGAGEGCRITPERHRPREGEVPRERCEIIIDILFGCDAKCGCRITSNSAETCGPIE